MRVQMMSAAVAAIGLTMWAAPGFAQHEGHQMPGMAVSGNANASACAQHAKTVSGAIDRANAQVEDARQLNDPARLRTAVGDVQVVLTQIKGQLADCVALAPEASGMDNMPGMDHSKMQMAPGTPTTQPGARTPAPGAAPSAMAGMDHASMAGMDHSTMNMGASAKSAEPEQSTSQSTQTSTLAIEFKADPSPVHAGENSRFAVTVKDKGGKPVSDVAVALALYMPPIPSMKMPAMRSTVRLTSAGDGVYRGEGSFGMAGDWDVTITVTRGHQQLASKKIKVKAQ